MESAHRKHLGRRTLAWATLAALLCVPATALAQSDAERIRDLERRLEQSLRVIDRLEKRVDQLERSSNASATTAAPAARAPQVAGAAPSAAEEERLRALEQNMAQIAASRSSTEGAGGVPVHGFADAGYEHSDAPRTDDRRAGFLLGNLDLFFTPEFGRVKTLAELNFEIDEGGAVATDLERLQLGYTFSDGLTGWLGRFHTPYGYWNNAFHHGAQIQTAVTRPRFIDFEDKGGILPAHSVGMWATGHTRAYGGNWQYDAWLANGSRIVDGVLDFNAHRDDNANKGFGGSLAYRFGGALDGLTLGVHGFREDVAAYAMDALQAKARVNMYGAWFYLDRDNWEAIGEYYRFRDQDLTGGGGTRTSWAGFVQVGYTVASLWTPYYRWEKAALDQADPYFAWQDSGRPYSRNVLGLRYALNANAALKLEANRTHDRILGEDASYSEWRAQFAVRF